MESIKKLIGDELRDVTSLGGFTFYAIVAIFFFLSDQYLMAVFLASGFVISLLITILIRAAWFRTRPHIQRFSDWIGWLDAASFPSLHSNRAVFMFITLSQYLNNMNMTIFISLITASVLYSRYHLMKHHISDIVVGAILGAAEYYFLVWVF